MTALSGTLKSWSVWKDFPAKTILATPQIKICFLYWDIFPGISKVCANFLPAFLQPNKQENGLNVHLNFHPVTQSEKFETSWWLGKLLGLCQIQELQQSAIQGVFF